MEHFPSSRNVSSWETSVQLEILFSGGSRRKNPTAALPDLSRDELLAILDLIEKSGDSNTEARTVPPRYPSTTSKPLYPIVPTEDTRPATTRSPIAPICPPEKTPSQRPAYPSSEIDPHAPPNYPAPVAPPVPATTTPKPKKSFFNKLIGGFLKIVSSQNAGASDATRSSPAAMLNSFLAQLQNAQQSDSQRKDSAPASSANVLDSLLQRLKGQNSEGSQFVTNLIQTLQASNGPPTRNEQSRTPARSGSTEEDPLLSFLRSVTQDQQGNSSGSSFSQILQKELFNRNANAPSSADNRSAADLLLEGFKQVLQQSGRQ